MGEYFMNLIILFLLYSFIGWIIETVFKSIRDKRFINSGFLTGPFCPIYGFGALLIVQSTKILDDIFIFKFLPSIFVKVILFIILTTILEYCTGLLLEKLFKCTWWDYSDEFLNIKGRICLKYSIMWGILAYIFLQSIHPLFSFDIVSTSLLLKYIFLTVIVIYFTWDITKSIKEIINLKEIVLVNYKKPFEEFCHNLLKYKRIYSAFPGLQFPYIGKVNQEIRGFLNDKIQKLKFQVKNMF